MLLSDIRECKAVLEISPLNTREDAKLNFFIEWVSAWIEEYLGRGDLSIRSRTEYYNGSGTEKLLLRSRPVYPSPAPQVWVDEAGLFGQVSGSFTNSESELTFGEDFGLWVEPGEQGLSRNGILIRNNNLWPKPSRRQRGYLSPFIAEGYGTIKVVYTAGYTVDNLPAPIRQACVMGVTRLRYVLPLGLELNSESYEDRSISSSVDAKKNFIMSLVKPSLTTYRNWTFG